MKGRRPKPLAIHKLQGTFRADRHAELIAAPAGEPTMPAHLDQVAQAEWRRVVREMDAMGTLSSADASTIASHAVSYSHAVAAEKELQRNGLVAVLPSGAVRPSPWLKIFENATAALRQYAIELGLSPSARTRLTLGPPAVPESTGVLKRSRA